MSDFLGRTITSSTSGGSSLKGTDLFFELDLERPVRFFEISHLVLRTTHVFSLASNPASSTRRGRGTPHAASPEDRA
jgi:hypothetical protein